MKANDGRPMHMWRMDFAAGHGTGGKTREPGGADIVNTRVAIAGMAVTHVVKRCLCLAAGCGSGGPKPTPRGLPACFLIDYLHGRLATMYSLSKR